MEVISRKRARSPSSPIILQQKIHINEKIVNNNDVHKLKQIHAKTLEMLFTASRNLNKTPTKPTTKKIQEQLVLTGNGTLSYRQLATVNALQQQHKVKCCDRKAYVQDTCDNCAQALCEYCGYSCTDCFVFLCNRCVSLFECGSPDKPICKNCTLYA